MIRLRILVEGPTEEDFVNEVLAPHLWSSHKIAATATGVGETKGGRGIVGWRNALRHIRNSLLEDGELYVTTLVDYYALPSSWPGRSEASAIPYTQRSSFIADKIKTKVDEEMGENWRGKRFIPFVVVHEFETLLFSDPAATSRAIGIPKLEAAMESVLEGFDSPEQINDSWETCPSRRLERIFEEGGFGNYQKPLHGNVAALEIGFDRMCERCPQFADWLNKLQALASS